MVGHGWVDTLSIAPLSPAVTQVVAQTLLYCLDLVTVAVVSLLHVHLYCYAVVDMLCCPCKTLSNNAQYCKKRTIQNRIVPSLQCCAASGHKLPYLWDLGSLPQSPYPRSLSCALCCLLYKISYEYLHCLFIR